MAQFDCPSYNGDVQRDGGFPDGAAAFRGRLEASDALVISSPEYNASLPGLLKNAIDWVSRFHPQPFHERHVLLLSASPNAKIDFSRVQLTGTAMLPGADGKPAAATRKVTPLTEIYMPGGGRGTYPVDTQGVAITEPNDIEVSVDNAQVTLTPGGTAKIEVTIKRRADYNKAVTLDLRVNHLGGVHTNPLPPGVTCDDAITIPEGQNKGTIVLKAAADAHAIKDWPLAVMTNVSINFVMKTWYVAPITLTVPPKK